MTIPSDLTVTSTGCTATIGGTSMECAMVGKSVTATHSLTSSVAEKEIIIAFDQITNPSSTKPTESFLIYSQEQVSGTYYSVDGVISGFGYSVSTLGSITSATVTRDSLNSDKDGLKTGKSTNFLFSFVIANDLATDGAISLIMPTESDAKISSTSTDYQCSATD
mmetsp:Transcript_13935/g.16148  ORF Transcript_13935/g.16148 Transcript_13935/m.16148 type:complete len:165 (-) Transcript_13935:86-580(-)